MNVKIYVNISHKTCIKKNLDKVLHIFLNNTYPYHILNKGIYDSNFHDVTTVDQAIEFKYKISNPR